MISSFSIANIDCHIYADGTPKVVFYWGTAKGHTNMEQILELIKNAGGKDYILCSFEANDWNSDFSPWPAPPVFGKEGFSGNGNATLDFLTHQLMPYVESHYPEAALGKKILAGYSLAGLFSLWAALTAGFDGTISCSGSLWFPGWLNFLENTPQASPNSNFYLSLGDTESKTKNKIMATVSDNTLKTVEFLEKTANCRFEWNKGGHFNDSEKRLAKGFMHFLD